MIRSQFRSVLLACCGRRPRHVAPRRTRCIRFKKTAALRSVLLRRRELRRLQSRRRDGRRLRAVLVRRAEVHRAARVSTRPKPFDIDGYSENFFAFTHDVERRRLDRHRHHRLSRRGVVVVRQSAGQGRALAAACDHAGDRQRIADVHRRHGRRPAGARVPHRRPVRLRRDSEGRSDEAVDVSCRSRRSATISGSRTAWASAT